MTGAPSTRGLFLATRPRAVPDGAGLFGALPKEARRVARDPLDFDPTPPDATAAFLAREAGAIGVHVAASGCPVWEPAVGRGDLAGVLSGAGFDVVGSDVTDRGFAGVVLRSFFDFTAADAPSPVQVTNPPFGLISARDGKGRWLRHAFDLGASYVALLLGADWPLARINGFDDLFATRPPSVEYACCWKIDFRGGGSPPQRNSWFVWDDHRPALGPNEWRRVRLYRDAPNPDQGDLL